MVARCDACTVAFQPQTPKIETKDGKVYHAGCWAKINRAMVQFAQCSHYTPAEDSSKWAFAHRTWGCPDEGAIWPQEWEEMAMHD